MQIKLRSNGHVQLLRAEYDRINQRTRQKSLGSFDSAKITSLNDLPTGITTALRSDERDQLSNWFDEQAATIAIKMKRDRISNAGETISDIVEALESSEVATAEQIKAVLKAIPRLTRAISKRGITKKDLIAGNIDEIIAAIRVGTPDADRNRLRGLCEVIARGTDPSKRDRNVIRTKELIAELHRSGRLPASVTLDDFLDSVSIVE
jgi:hypothetical protein